MSILTLNRNASRLHFTTKGKIIYDPARPGMKKNTAHWAIVSVDKEITRYYRWWVKQHYHIDLCQPSWDAHVSVVRGERVGAENAALWRRLHGKSIDLQYGAVPKQVPGKPHFWYISCDAPEIAQIRNELGLKTEFFQYHITIGRTYGDHEYIR